MTHPSPFQRWIPAIGLSMISAVVAAAEPIDKSSDSGRVDVAAQRFINETTMECWFEIRISQAALSMNISKIVHDFAEKQLRSDQESVAKISALAKREGYQLPNDLDHNRQHRLDALEKFQGDDFVMTFDKDQRESNDQMISLCDDEAAHGQDAQMKDLAASLLKDRQDLRQQILKLPGLTDQGTGNGNIPRPH